MNKAPIFLLLILLAVISFGKLSFYANASENLTQVKLNQAVKIDEDSKIFEIDGEGKNKTQFRIKDNHNNENSEFMIKGVISAFTSDSLTIDSKTIKIDSSVTGDIKIVGKINVGAYAMAKGEIVNSNYYAEKIVVDQRNKKEVEQSENPTPSATPTVTLTPTVTPSSTQSAAVEESEDENTNINLDLSNIIQAVQNFLNYLVGIASKI